ncbi:MAG: hypothetical protein AAF572_26865 [Cyanobacteria bacterium P01_B01_bin.77]
MRSTQEMPSKRPRLIVYLTPDVKERYEQLAKLRNRTASNLTETLILKAIWEAEQSGELSPADDTKTQS